MPASYVGQFTRWLALVAVSTLLIASPARAVTVLADGLQIVLAKDGPVTYTLTNFDNRKATDLDITIVGGGGKFDKNKWKTTNPPFANVGFNDAGTVAQFSGGSGLNSFGKLNLTFDNFKKGDAFSVVFTYPQPKKAAFGDYEPGLPELAVYAVPVPATASLLFLAFGGLAMAALRPKRAHGQSVGRHTSV
jgi:hypothetical protein